MNMRTLRGEGILAVVVCICNLESLFDGALEVAAPETSQEAGARALTLQDTRSQAGVPFRYRDVDF